MLEGDTGIGQVEIDVALLNTVATGASWREWSLSEDLKELSEYLKKEGFRQRKKYKGWEMGACPPRWRTSKKASRVTVKEDMNMALLAWRMRWPSFVYNVNSLHC